MRHYNASETMDRRIAELNIEHLEGKLAEEVDPQVRQTIVRLIAEEKAKLADILHRRSDKRYSA